MIKLDIACGNDKPDGWIGLDLAPLPGVDLVHDVLSFPWPVESGSVGEARCKHFLEHVPAGLRVAFFNELHRVLAPGAGCTFITPLDAWRAAQDFSHEWPPIVPASYLYYNREWRERVGIGHYAELYGITCEFEPARVQFLKNPSPMEGFPEIVDLVAIMRKPVECPA